MIVLVLFVILVVVIFMIVHHRNLLKETETAQVVAENVISEDDENSIRKVYIPDNADAKGASTKSTQDVDCKTVTVDTNQAVEKIVVGNDNNEDDDLMKNM